MSEVNITTVVNPATVNKLRMNLYLAKSPGAVLATILQDWQAENHWIFTNLIPGSVYIYNLFEESAGGLTLQQYTKSPNFTVLQGGDIQVKSPQDIQVGVTPGLTAGANTATFADWKGWDITVEDIGAGTMKRGTAYSYDITTGTITLLGQDHKFIPFQRFFVRFEPKIIGTAPTNQNLWSDVLVVTDNKTLVAADAGKKIILAGAGSFFTVTLPQISTVTDNTIFWFESGIGNHINATITTPNGNSIDFLEGSRTNLYIGRRETIAIYRYQNTWRVHSYNGNFLTVGSEFTSYGDSFTNAIEMNGSQLSVNEYARLYNDFVLKKDQSEVVDFNNWLNTSNPYNIFKFSKASSGVFRIPDLRGKYIINSGVVGRTAGATTDSVTKPGDFQLQTMLDARVALFSDGVPTNGKPSKSSFVGWSSNRQNGNQDYDLLVGNGEPSLGVSGQLIDKYGNPIGISDKLTTDRVATRRFILI